MNINSRDRHLLADVIDALTDRLAGQPSIEIDDLRSFAWSMRSTNGHQADIDLAAGCAERLRNRTAEMMFRALK